MITFSSSDNAKRTLELVTSLQNKYVKYLEDLASKHNVSELFKNHQWLRNEGTNGGGFRYSSNNNQLLNQASINVSQVHYVKQERLKSATALSAIVHPDQPKLPSMHMHLSYTELASGVSSWRIMADLNPSIENTDHQNKFNKVSKEILQEHYEQAKIDGDNYFYIPALKRFRGVTHFYIESLKLENFDSELNFVSTYGNAIIDCYIDFLDSLPETGLKYFSNEEKRIQTDYHTLYFFQVLTLDRGTTAGILVHNQNDLGVLGSLPNIINKKLLSSWKTNLAFEQARLLDLILNCLPNQDTVELNDSIKYKLCNALREFYKQA